MEMTLGERVKAARNKKRLTQGQLADKLGMSYHNIQNLESGRTKTCRFLEPLAEALGTTPNHLFAGSKENVITVEAEVNLVSLDKEIEFKPRHKYHVVEIKDGSPLFLTGDAVQVGEIDKIFQQKIK